MLVGVLGSHWKIVVEFSTGPTHQALRSNTFFFVDDCCCENGSVNGFIWMVRDADGTRLVVRFWI